MPSPVPLLLFDVGGSGPLWEMRFRPVVQGCVRKQPEQAVGCRGGASPGEGLPQRRVFADRALMVDLRSQRGEGGVSQAMAVRGIARL